MTAPDEFRTLRHWWRSRDPLTQLMLGLAAMLLLLAVVVDIAWWFV